MKPTAQRLGRVIAALMLAWLGLTNTQSVSNQSASSKPTYSPPNLLADDGGSGTKPTGG